MSFTALVTHCTPWCPFIWSVCLGGNMWWFESVFKLFIWKWFTGSCKGSRQGPMDLSSNLLNPTCYSSKSRTSHWDNPDLSLTCVFSAEGSVQGNMLIPLYRVTLVYKDTMIVFCVTCLTDLRWNTGQVSDCTYAGDRPVSKSRSQGAHPTC